MDDHYVSQTYLGSFTNSEGYLIPYYKSANAVLGNPKPPKSVCYEVDGDSNKYFDDPRILDSYLPQFENPWTWNVERLREHVLDDIMKYQIAGYIAFLRTCTPTAKRIGQTMIKATVQPTFEETTQRHFRDHPSEDEETKSIIGKAIEQKNIDVEIDRQFPHAMGISSLIKLTERYFYCKWLVLLNNLEVPFLTSDNPAVTYYHTNDHSRGRIYVPVAPDVAILINADLGEDRFAEPKAKYVEVFDDLIIKAAEKRVFSNSAESWIEAKVREFMDWRMEAVVDELPHLGGRIIVTRQLVRKIELA